MRANWLFLSVLLPGLAAQALDVCDPAGLVGPYAFQLTGLTSISGTPRPTVSLGRLAFDGTGGTRVQFKQTDPGGAQRGIMQRTSDACSAADLLAKYSFTVSGSATPMLPGEAARTVSAKGTLDVAANGSFQVDSDCSVRFGLTLPAPDGQVDAPLPMNMRGFLVDGGREIIAFQTDPGAMVAARFSSDKN